MDYHHHQQQQQPIYLSSSPTPIQQQYYINSNAPQPILLNEHSQNSFQPIIQNVQQSNPSPIPTYSNTPIYNASQVVNTNGQSHGQQLQVQRNSLIVANNSNSNIQYVVVGVDGNGVPILQAVSSVVQPAPTVNYVQPIPNPIYITANTASSTSYIEPVASEQVPYIKPEEPAAAPTTTTAVQAEASTTVEAAATAGSAASAFLWGLIMSIVGIFIPFCLWIGCFIFLCGAFAICSSNKLAVPYGILNSVAFVITLILTILEIAGIIGAIAGGASSA